MQQQIPKLYKIRKDKLNTWLTWCEKIRTSLHDEARTIITNEGLLSELFIDFEINGENYTLGIMISAQHAEHTTKVSDSDINVEHSRIMRECLIPVAAIS
jgi:hypothetical protein